MYEVGLLFIGLEGKISCFRDHLISKEVKSSHYDQS